MRLLVESNPTGNPPVAPAFGPWYQTAIDAQPDGIGLLEVSDRDAPRLVTANAAFYRLAGLSNHPRGALPLYDMVDTRFAAAVAAACERCVAGDAPSLDRCELRSGEPRIYEITALPYRFPRSRPVLVTVVAHDITEAEVLRRTLQDRERHLQAFFEHAPDHIARYDTAGRVLYTNETVNHQGPANRAQSLGRTSIEISPHSRGAHRFHECVLEVARTGKPMEIYVHIDALESTAEIWHHVRFAAERDPRGEVVAVLAIGRDVTEHRRLEHALLDVANREQMRLGSELHDGLGQDLTGLALLASSLAEGVRRGGTPTAASLDCLAKLAADAIRTCGDIARGLSPLATHDGNLVRALTALADLQRHSYGVPVTFELTGSAPLDLNATQIDHLYRIAQEGLTNARKHANATSIVIRIDLQPDRIRLSITDDGSGMASMTGTNAGLGLMTMRHRASIIGARFTIDSAAGAGTTLTCECPPMA